MNNSKYHRVGTLRSETYLCACGKDLHLKQKLGSALSNGIKRNLKREDW